LSERKSREKALGNGTREVGGPGVNPRMPGHGVPIEKKVQRVETQGALTEGSGFQESGAVVGVTDRAGRESKTTNKKKVTGHRRTICVNENGEGELRGERKKKKKNG